MIAGRAALPAGELIRPRDPAYDRHRAVFDAAVDARPAAIARCRTREDVAAALALAAEHALPVAVRSAAMSDLATVAAGLVVDVSPMKGVRIDAGARTARVAAGVTWAELDAAAQEHGLAVTGARASRIGVAGTALGGGTGWLERSLGPTCASLEGAELVLADGRAVRAGADGDPELLWALRGGGGNFGVACELELRLHPVGPELLGGFLTFPRERAGAVARAFRDELAGAPDAAGGALVLFAGRGGACTVVFCFAGPVEEGERALAPLRALGPSMDAVRPNPYAAIQAMHDLNFPWGARCRLRARFLRELPDEALDALVAAADAPAAALSQVMLQPLGGALARVGEDDAALGPVAAPWAYQCTAMWPPLPSLDRGNLDWLERVERALEPFALDASLPCLVAGDEGSDRAIASYGGALARLRRVKARYDPGNVFRRNANIEPAS